MPVSSIKVAVEQTAYSTIICPHEGAVEFCLYIRSLRTFIYTFLKNKFARFYLEKMKHV